MAMLKKKSFMPLSFPIANCDNITLIEPEIFSDPGRTYVPLIPKKVELLIRFFKPFWISRVFPFSLRTFEKVEDLPDPLEPLDETYTQSKFDISGSNETMQNAVA